MTDPGKEPDRGQPPLELMNTAAAAEFLRLSPVTLAHYRHQGGGPVYRKHGWRVYYDKADLVTWSERQQWSSSGNPLRRNS